MMKPSSCKTGETNWQEICGFYTHSEYMLLLKTQLLFFLSPFIHSFIFFVAYLDLSHMATDAQTSLFLQCFQATCQM